MLGFKSFMGKTALDFEQGITAVLGPNGCGKSNIVDAIRWVLGEQSAKLLRGTKMENVIFDGTKRRAPMGFAEVTLSFTGASESLPVEYDEISITRRVTRAGGSEYFLNRQPYRLHEIRDLLAGTGLGNHVYSIIELGMVKDILAESGDKRRLLFEEASGVMRYKLRRKESLAKLAATEGDLTRLADILDELGKSVRSLKVQVSRARSYQRVKEELTAAERQLAAAQLHGYWQRQRELRRRQEGVSDASRESEARVASLEAALAAQQLELVAREEEYKRRRDALDEATGAYRSREEELAVLDERARAEERQVAQLEQEARLAAEAIARLEIERRDLEAERSELEALAERLEGELAAAEADLGDLETRFGERRGLLTREKQLQLDFARQRAETGGEVERLRERLAAGQRRQLELEAEAESLAAQSAQREGELGGLRQSEAAAAATLLGLQSRLASLRAEREQNETGRLEVEALLRELDLKAEKAAARHELLVRLRDEGAGFPEGTRRLLERHAGDSALVGALGDMLRVEDRYRLAIECALERELGALVVKGGRGLSWLEQLRDEEGGRALLIELAGVAPAPRPAAAAPAGCRQLIDFVDGPPELHAALARLLARHQLAPDAETARAALAAPGGEELVIVTPEGFVFQRGLVAGGSTGPEESRPLGRGEEIAVLERELAALAPQRERLLAARADHQETQGRLRAALEALDAELPAARARLAERETERARVETRLARSEEEAQAVADERALQGRQALAFAEALAAAESGLAQLGEEQPGEAIDLPALETEVARLERELGGARGRVTERRLEKTAARGRRDNLRLREENLERNLAGQWSRRESSESGAAESRGQVLSLRERAQALREGLGNERRGLEEKRGEAEALLGEITGLREAAGERQAEGRRLREAQRESEQAAHALELEISTLGVKMEDLQTRVREELGAELDPAVDPTADPAGYAPAEGQSLAEAVSALKEKLARLGVVNLLALEEFTEKNGRYEFLLAQQADLVAAREQLLETIRAINTEAKQRFTESFKVIRENFIQIFLTLFDGGEADLAFTVDPDDPLEGDIVVTAKPREKNISTVQLLSSGEKTLTALALLFAVYLSQPSPFCVFDEVDAPLDDANIARFTKLVREFSARTQFVVITHNKRTMEAAGHLYGVTMEESGVSKLVSVALEDVPDDFDAARAAGAAS